jgi:hypothetical protein
LARADSEPMLRSRIRQSGPNSPGIVNLSGRGMLVVWVARQFGSGNSFARLLMLPRSSRAGFGKAPWLR